MDSDGYLNTVRTEQFKQMMVPYSAEIRRLADDDLLLIRRVVSDANGRENAILKPAVKVSKPTDQNIELLIESKDDSGILPMNVKPIY